MTTHHREKVQCECGHNGILHWKENDQPFSKQWESYKIEGFEGENLYIEGFMTTSTALEKINPKCPSCGEVGRVDLVKN